MIKIANALGSDQRVEDAEHHVVLVQELPLHELKARSLRPALWGVGIPS